jgi:ankyrin repeat protein
MLYGMGTFLLCGSTELRPIGKDDETQMVETNVAEANEDPIVPKIDCLIDAMRKGDSEKALQLLEGIEDKDINRRGRERPITPLGAAVLWNHMDVAQVLLERGADLNMACFDPDAEYCDPRDQIYEDCTPFGMAIINKDKKMIELLLKHGADVNALVLRCHPLQMFLNNYFDLCSFGDGYFCPISGGPLRLDHDYLQLDDADDCAAVNARYFGAYNDCLQFLPPGQNCLLLDNKGLNIINDCCSKNILKVMELLIENGADVNNTKNEEGNTILHDVAGSFSHGGPFSFELVELLFEAGADPRIADNEGKLPLQEPKLPDHVTARFPERVEIYNKLRNMFQQRIDELNAQENKSPEE